MGSARRAGSGISGIGGKIAVLALLALLGFSIACSSDPKYKQRQLAAPGQSQPQSSSNSPRAPLRVAVAGVISPKETYRSYQDFLQYLGARLDRPIELVQRKTYAEINDLVRAGGIDLAFVCSLAYVQGQQEFGMELLAAPEVRGEATYRSYLIVPTDSHVTGFEQLRDKMFAFTDPDSNSGRLVPTYTLWQSGQTPETFFRKVVYTYSHDNSIKAVADKLVDGASVDSLVYDYLEVRNLELVERTRVVWRSEPLGAPPVVVHPRMAPDLKAQLRELILGMDADPEGRAILDRLMIDRFVAVSPANYDSIREMWRKVRGQP